MLKRRLLNLRKLWLSLLLMVGATAIAVPGIQEIAEDGSVAKIDDTEYATLQAAFNAANDGGVIEIIKAGDYTLPNISKNVTIEGKADGVVSFTHTSGGNIASISSGATFKNVTFNFGNENYHGFQHAGTINMEGCTLNGKLFSYGDMNFTNCEFKQTNSDYNMWVYGAGNVVYNQCTFSNTVTGKLLHLYCESADQAHKVTVKDCKFVNEGSQSKAAINVKATSGSNALQYELHLEGNNTYEGSFPTAVGEQDNSDHTWILSPLAQVDDRKVSPDNIKVYENDVLIYPESIAKIGDVTYPSLQSALDAAHEMTGDVTVELLKDIEGFSIVHQKEGLNLTIDGAGKKVSSNIIVEGDGRAKGAETLTIQNIKFEGDGTNFCSGTSSFVEVPSCKTSGTPYYTNKYNYAHNITVTNCSFTSTKSDLTMAAIRSNSAAGAYNLAISDCTGTNLHSLAQLTGTTGGSVTNNTVTASESFMNVNGGDGEFTVSGNTFTSAEGADGYGIRENGSSTAVITLSDNTFIAASSIVLGKGNSVTAGTIKVESGVYTGTISKTEAATGKIAISGGYFSEEFPQEYIAADLIAQGKICTPATDKEGFYTVGDPLPVARIGNTEYATLEAAVAAAQEGETVEVLVADEYTLPGISKNITIEGTVDGVVFKHTTAGNIASIPNGATFKNVTFNFGNVNYHGFQHAGTITMEDCTLNGLFFSYGDMNFTNCEFNQTNSDYHMWAYSGNLTYTGCTFTNTATGKFLNVYNESGATKYTVTANNCKFVNTASAANKAAINVKATSGSNLLAYDVIINNCTTEGAFPEASESQALVVLKDLVQVDDRTADGVDNIKVYENDVLIYPVNYVAKIGNVKYETLEEAFAAAQDGETITLLADCTGNGIKAPKGKFANGLTVDFAGFTYTVDGSTVGSTGTETNAFQLLKDNKITFKNGTITSEKAKILVQNYSDLTLEGMTLTLNNANYTSAYTLSNNNGNIVIDGTTINANPAGGFAFDVCRYSSYPSVNVTVKGESVINGNIEVSASKSDAKDGFSLMLESCTLTGEIVLDASAKAAMAATPEKATVTKSNSLGSITAPEEYKWKDNGNETSSLVLKTYVAKIGDVQYETLADAVAAVPADGTETTITMIADETIVGNAGVIIPVGKNIVLDLNGKTITLNVAESKGSQLITNNGTLTIVDSSEDQNGKLTNAADEGLGVGTWPSNNYVTNIITNAGVLNIEAGTIQNTANGSICYAVDNNSTSRNATLNIKGGVLTAVGTAVRQFCNSATYENNVNISGGEVVTNGSAALWIQLPGSDATKAMKASLNVTGGTLTGSTYAFYDYSYGNSFDATLYNLSGGTFNGGIFSYGANINITDGTYNSWIAIKQAKPSEVSVSGGKFADDVYTYGDNASEGFISGGIFATKTYVDEGVTYDCEWLNCLADGYVVSDNTDEATKAAYPYAVREGNYICAIGETKYESLQDAVNAAGTAETTITLLTDAATDGVISGNGVKVPSGSNITFDLNGLTYDASGVTVGSTSTETQGFQLLKGSNITFKNGTLKATSPTAQMLIQNYSNLTLEDVNLDGTGLSGWAYALSNNCGTINLTGSTSITAKEGGRAFDTCKFGSYEIPTVNINTTGTISGTIEATGGKLNIEKGKFNVTWVTDNNYNAGDIQIKGGVFTEKPAEEYCAEGYVPTDNTDEETKVQYPFAVMTKEDAGIFELIDGKVYPYLDYTEDKPAASVTYKRNFANYNWQALFIPFDINDVTKLTDKYEFAKVHMVALENDGTFTTGNKIEIYYTRVTSGKLSANQPYLIKLKNGAEQGWQDIVVENTILKDTHNMTPRKTSTMAADYYFTGTYEGYVGEKYHDFMAMGSGTINWGNKGHKLGTYRWYIKTVPYNDDYAKTTINFIEVDEEATGISAASTADNAEIEGYYTVNGVRSDVPVKGMNIVKYKNGKTKKIMIK